MKSLRRENVSTVPGHKVWRQRIRLPLTPHAVKKEMAEEGRLKLTPLDKLLEPAQAYALERWALNEQTLSGKTATQNWESSKSRCGTVTEFSPISDNRIEAVMTHSAFKKRLPDYTLDVLAAFTAMQNRHEGALSAAQYGFVYCPNAKNKSAAFLHEIVGASDVLVEWKY